MAQDSSPLSPSPYTISSKRPSHHRQSSTKSLSFLVLSSSHTSTSTPSSYRPSQDYVMPPLTSPSAFGLHVPPPSHPTLSRRSTDGKTSSGASTVGSETVHPASPSPSMASSDGLCTLSSPTRVKRSCSTSALTALSLSSNVSPRLRQMSGKATVA